MNFTIGARPIKRKKYLDFYKTAITNLSRVELDEYLATFRRWIVDSKTKTILGLDAFTESHFTNGTSQAFDHFILRHHNKRIVTFAGEFQYHGAITRHSSIRNRVITSAEQLCSGDAFIISCPFSDLGAKHPLMDEALTQCNLLGIPVLIDLAYWGISKDVMLDLSKNWCVEEVTCSLSKPFWVLETHRIGIRFTRSYIDGGISMINEVGMTNNMSRFLGTEFMNQWSCDAAWEQQEEYLTLVNNLNLQPTNCVIFALDRNDKYSEFNRGIVGSNRICISNYLSDTNENLYA